MAEKKLWGLRTSGYSARVKGYTSRNKTVMPKKIDFTEITLKQILLSASQVAAKLYVETVFIYIIWNNVLAEKISGIKPVDGLSAFGILMLLNFIRTPKEPFRKTFTDIFGGEQ